MCVSWGSAGTEEPLQGQGTLHSDCMWEAHEKEAP